MMIMKKHAGVLLLFCAAMIWFAAAMGAAQDVAAKPEEKTLSVDEIVKKANHVSYYQGKDGRANVDMAITFGQGGTQSRGMTILRLNEDEKDEAQKYYVYFDKPADHRNMAFMVWKHVTKDDDRWLYLPALDLVKRIAASDKRTSFVGSDYLYEDVSGRSLAEDTHTLESTDDKYYVVKNDPKDPKSVEFSSYKVWIDKATFLPMKAEYLDKNGKLYRTMAVLETGTFDGFATAVKSKISNLATGGNTVMTFSNVKYNAGLPGDIFTERYLRRAPQKWLKGN